jgi:hypothetical protein
MLCIRVYGFQVGMDAQARAQRLLEDSAQISRYFKYPGWAESGFPKAMRKKEGMYIT